MKQARDRFQNIVPALETLATEFYGCHKFAWAQKITALNNGNELLNTRYHLNGEDLSYHLLEIKRMFCRNISLHLSFSLDFCYKILLETG